MIVTVGGAISAKLGDNVVHASTRMPWFDGKPLLALLETLPPAIFTHHTPFRFPVQLVRRGKPHAVTIKVNELGWRDAWNATNQHGMVLRSIAGVGSEVVVVEPGSPANHAGVRRGDVIVSLDEYGAPEPSRIDRMFAAARARDVLLITVQRDAGHRILALEKP